MTAVPNTPRALLLKRKYRGLSLLCLLVSVLSILNGPQALMADPPLRSTDYNGSSYMSYADHDAFKPSDGFTIEAWVYRENNTRCETIVSKNFTNSWWLGFCNKLRFYSANFSFVDSTRDVPSQQWCHIAVTHDGNSVAFFIDGEEAGAFQNVPNIANNTGPMTIGADVAGGFPLEGRIDELRIWHTARTKEEINNDMYREVRTGPSLEAVFGDGGKTELIRGLTGTEIGTLTCDPFGILPQKLTIPFTSSPPSIDGILSNEEYEGAEQAVIRYHDGTAPRDALVKLLHNGTDLYVAFEHLRPAVDANTNPGIIIFIDPDQIVNDHPTSTELATSMLLSPGAKAGRYQGDNEFGFMACETSQACPEEFAVDGSATISSSEFRISTAILDANQSDLRLAFQHFGFQTALPNSKMAPGNSTPSNPSSWALAELESAPLPPGGDGDCQVPFEVPSDGPFPFSRVDPIDNLGSSISEVSCLPLPTPGPEAHYSFTPVEGGTYRFSAYSPEGNNVAILIGLNCPSEENTCLKGSDQFGDKDPEVLQITLEANTTYIVTIDSSSSSESGNFYFQVDKVELELPVVTRILAPGPNDFPFARNQMARIWKEDPQSGEIVGEIDEKDAENLSRNGIGVATYETPREVQLYEPKPSLRFSKFFHDIEESDEVELQYLDPSSPVQGQIQAFIATESGNDFEQIVLDPDGDRWSARIKFSLGQQQGQPLDGELQLNIGEVLIGLQKDPNASDPLMAISMLRGRKTFNTIAIDFDETLDIPTTQTPGRGQAEAPRPVGGIADDTGTILSLGSDQLVIDSRFGDFGNLVERLNATVVDQGNDGLAQTNPYKLIRFDPDQVNLDDAQVLLELVGAQGTFRVTNEATLAMIVISIEERLRGSNVTPNFLIQLHGSTALGAGEDNVFGYPVGNDSLQGAQRAWMMTQVLGNQHLNSRKVKVAVIDSDFCDRLPEEVSVDGGYNFHALSTSPYGITGPLGDKRYHGTKMATALGGIFHNGVGSAGSGGQVADLLLYNVGGLTYYYEAAAATLAATSDGARVINMSFGFPCSIGGINLCQLGGGPFLCLILGPIIDAALLLAQPFLPFPVPPFGACFVIAGYLEGMNAAITSAIGVAQAADIVVVASAGNPLEGMDPAPMEAFHIIPAVIPGVFSVGATNSSYENTMMYGFSIDAWVLEDNRSWSPPTENENCEGFTTQSVGGTSAAAAYVSGLVAQIRSANPSLSATSIKSILRRNFVRSPAPGNDSHVLRFLRSDEAFFEAVTRPIGPHPDPRPIFPSLAFDENPRTHWLSSQPFGWVTSKPDYGDSAGSPIPISFSEAESGKVIEDAGIHAFTADGMNENDFYRIAPAPDGTECTPYNILVSIEYYAAGSPMHITADVPAHTATLSNLGDTFQHQFRFRNVFMDEGFNFRAVGTNFYRMVVLIDEESSIAVDRFESNQDATEATPIAESEFSTFNSGFWWEHRLLLEDLSFHCATDVDTFMVDFPPLNEDCSDTSAPCGQEFAARRMTRLRFTGEGLGRIEVYPPSDLDPDPSEAIATGTGSVEIPCPASDLGLGRVLVKLYPQESIRTTVNYQLSVRYSAPLVAPHLNPNNFLCCEHPAGCDAPGLEIDPSVFDVDSWSPSDPDRHPSEYDLICPPGECIFPPSMYYQINWLEPEHLIGLGIDFNLPVSDAFEGVLLNLDHEVVASFEDVNGNRLNFELQAEPLPEGFYFLRLRGIAHRSVYRLYNLDPLPIDIPESNSIVPQLQSTSVCGDEATFNFNLQSDLPVTGFSFGLKWNPERAQFIDAELGSAINPSDVLTFIVQRNREEFGEAVIGVILNSGTTLDATETIEACRATFRTPEGSVGSSAVEICTATELGSPPVQAVVSVLDGETNRSTFPSLGCATVNLQADVIPPTLHCPEDMTVNGGPNGMIVTWDIEAVDTCSDVTVTCTPESGSFFPIGTTQVICEAEDASGNITECSFEVTVTESGGFRRSDANSDQVVDITDPITMLSFLFIGDTPITCMDAADANDDGLVDITDPITALSFLFLGTIEIPAPGVVECGPDPTEDDLADCDYPNC